MNSTTCSTSPLNKDSLAISFYFFEGYDLRVTAIRATEQSL